MTTHNQTYVQRRLRVFDLATPWFWFVIFYFGKRYGNTWAEVNLFDGVGWGRRFWYHVWQWEDEPARQAEAHFG